MNNMNTDSLYHKNKSAYKNGEYILLSSTEALKQDKLFLKGRVYNIKNNLIDNKQVITGIYKHKKVVKVNTIHDGKSRGVWKVCMNT